MNEKLNIKNEVVKKEEGSSQDNKEIVCKLVDSEVILNTDDKLNIEIKNLDMTPNENSKKPYVLLATTIEDSSSIRDHNDGVLPPVVKTFASCENISAVQPLMANAVKCDNSVISDVSPSFPVQTFAASPDEKSIAASISHGPRRYVTPESVPSTTPPPHHSRDTTSNYLSNGKLSPKVDPTFGTDGPPGSPVCAPLRQAPCISSSLARMENMTNGWDLAARSVSPGEVVRVKRENVTPELDVAKPNVEQVRVKCEPRSGTSTPASHAYPPTHASSVSQRLATNHAAEVAGEGSTYRTRVTTSADDYASKYVQPVSSTCYASTAMSALRDLSRPLAALAKARYSPAAARHAPAATRHAPVATRHAPTATRHAPTACRQLHSVQKKHGAALLPHDVPFGALTSNLGAHVTPLQPTSPVPESQYLRALPPTTVDPCVAPVQPPVQPPIRPADHPLDMTFKETIGDPQPLDFTKRPRQGDVDNGPSSYKLAKYMLKTEMPLDLSSSAKKPLTICVSYQNTKSYTH